MATITLAGLIAALTIARMLNNRITRRVVNLISSTESLRKGNLQVFAREEGGDELSRLAYTFNVMAARIRKLVDNLELKVKERTAELSESERRFRQLFEHSSSGVAVYESFEDGKDFVFRDINKAVEIIEGVKRSKLVGKKITDVFPGVVEFGLLDLMLRVWQTGKSARHSSNYYSDGRLEGWRENAVYKLPSGEIVTVYDDLTARKQAEIESKAMEARLQRSQKMESIGLMAGGVAHDLNNILSGIINYPELLLMQIPKDSELRKLTLAIHESGQRAVAVVTDLLTFARGVACAKEPASLNRLVKEYMSSPEHEKLTSLHANVDCILNLDSHLQNINCSSVHIKKCVMNLVTNAMEAIDGSGRIIITTQNQHVDEKMALTNGICSGEYVLLTITDNGKGISEKDLEHIFEPFYTKKVMGVSGTGLGLAVVWSSVVDHGGTILVESSDKETSFILYFPVSEEVATPKVTDVGIEGLKGSRETILVVDDEPLLLDIASRMLKVLDYDAVCVDSGEKALTYLTENQVDMVLLGMVMESDLNSIQTFERIIQIHPNQKAIIISGLSESEDVKKAQQLGARGIIKKPYSIDELGRVLKVGMTG
jgi:PAS domain S-box-containing protein